MLKEQTKLDKVTRVQGGAPGAGEGDAPDAGQEGNNAGRVHYVCTFYRGTLPAPTGEVAQLVNRSATTAVLRARAESFYAFLSDPASDLRDLNGDNTLFTAMISVPGTNKVKIIYGMGLGTAQIGQVNPVANKIMALFGEGGSDLGTPQVLVVNPSIRDRVAVKSVRDTVIEQAFNTGITVDKHVAKAINVPEELQIMHIAPIPSMDSTRTLMHPWFTNASWQAYSAMTIGRQCWTTHWTFLDHV